MSTSKFLHILLIIFMMLECIAAQDDEVAYMKGLVQDLKSDVRGPYHRIQWFCKDGSIRDPKDPCPDSIGGGIQHASHKPAIIKLQKDDHLFLGDILSAIDQVDGFLDAEKYFSRLKQYQLGRYLASVDEGWILQKGQFYRGALQSEDEQAWGRTFFEWLVDNDTFVEQNYYFLRQALKDVPHNEETNDAQRIRSLSKVLADDEEAFMNIRIKIHGKPEASDIELVRDFIEKEGLKWEERKRSQFDNLLATMRNFYSIDFERKSRELSKLPTHVSSTRAVLDFLDYAASSIEADRLCWAIVQVLQEIRQHITDYENPKHRILLLDLTNTLEYQLITNVERWQTPSLALTLDKIGLLSKAALGTGIIEEWEANEVDQALQYEKKQADLSIDHLMEIHTTARSLVEWGVSMIKTQYDEVVMRYGSFEPLAYGFIDDRVRSSVALSLGAVVGDLGSYLWKVANMRNDVLTLRNQSALRGLNPGYALGELVVVDGNPKDIEVSANKIYVFETPPHDLKPVAGIMTVSEGNLVSHVQLLARNLGIPNAALTHNQLKSLQIYAGEEVFYAVSTQGNIVMKLAKEMTLEEKTLFEKKERTQNIIEVPTAQINLKEKAIIDMRNVDASSSGEICGPKAANLGELKKMFPDKVVEGLIIPFGVFKEHMDQEMPGTSGSYWEFLQRAFSKAAEMKVSNESQEDIDRFQLKALEKLHNSIVQIDLKEDLLSELEVQFQDVFQQRMGRIPVFLRSDTNMEDLKEFTGAGLNLTLFNIVAKEDILKGIRRVWASPYTERSFKWRQSYLSNPENVYPSILIIPSVDVDYSGVMITKGINRGTDSDLTVAFSRGAGGAVDGQSAETRLITKLSQQLLTPARQPDYIRLPKSGGTKRYYTSFNSPILNSQNIADIRSLANQIRKSLGSDQVYDVEFGFKDNQLWLFQIRPFVENSSAKSSNYLSAISAKVDKQKLIPLNAKIELP